MTPRPTVDELYAPREPTDAEIVAWVAEHYSREMAEQVQAAIRSTDAFGQHIRRSFVREMLEPVQ